DYLSRALTSGSADRALRGGSYCRFAKRVKTCCGREWRPGFGEPKVSATGADLVPPAFLPARADRNVGGTQARRAASPDPGELLERVTGGRHHPGAAAAGHRHLGHVDVAARIDPDAVRREEVAGRGRVVAAAPAGVELAGPVEDADAAARVAGLRRAGAGPAPRAEAQLGDVEPPARPVQDH